MTGPDRRFATMDAPFSVGVMRQHAGFAVIQTRATTAQS